MVKNNGFSSALSKKHCFPFLHHHEDDDSSIAMVVMISGGKHAEPSVA